MLHCKMTECTFETNTVPALSSIIGKDIEFYRRFVNNSGSVLYITNEDGDSKYELTQYTFVNNTSSGHGTALDIRSKLTLASSLPEITILECSFDNNVRISIVYINIRFASIKLSITAITVASTNFTNNSGSALYVSSLIFNLQSTVLFQNNHADIGAALYLYM